MTPTFVQTVPILRIFDEAKAREIHEAVAQPETAQ